MSHTLEDHEELVHQIRSLAKAYSEDIFFSSVFTDAADTIERLCCHQTGHYISAEEMSLMCKSQQAVGYRNGFKDAIKTRN